MTKQERLELLACAKAGHCALAIAADCGEADAFMILRGAIRAFVSAAVSLDFEQTRTFLRELELTHIVPAGAPKLYLAVNNSEVIG